MGDVERITTTERPLRDELAQAIRKAPANNYDAYGAVDAVLPIIERERVRVVEGLVATIKALPHGPLETGVDDGQGHHEVVEACRWDDVLLALAEVSREAVAGRGVGDG